MTLQVYYDIVKYRDFDYRAIVLPNPGGVVQESYINSLADKVSKLLQKKNAQFIACIRAVMNEAKVPSNEWGETFRLIQSEMTRRSSAARNAAKGRHHAAEAPALVRTTNRTGWMDQYD